jgi:hypothetical protein
MPASQMSLRRGARSRQARGEGRGAIAWPERPDSLKDATPEEVEAWREEQGSPDREA